MKRTELNQRLKAVVANYDIVVARLEIQTTRNQRKVSHRAVLDDFLVTRSLTQTARAFDLSDSGTYRIVYKAIRIAEDGANRDTPRRTSAHQKA